jgi:signal transduction histidine kinase
MNRAMTMADVPLTPEILVPRLGEYLVYKGLLSQADLQRALNYQQEMRKAGRPQQPIGLVLIELGMIDPVTRESAITELIAQLRNTLQDANHQLEQANQQLEKRVEERTAELQKALEKLAELSQLKANIVANISHELRTPLTHLKGYLELLVAGDLGPLTEAQQNGLQVMERSSERLGRLIEDLILFSVSERDQIHLRIQPFLVNQCCTSAADKIISKARERNIQVQVQCDSDLPQVDGDEDKISWVILQFLDNAIKFTSPGGKVKVKVTREDPLVNVAVIDTGIGIPGDRINEIFESFYQLDGSSTRRAGGTGLGLALAKKIVEAHGSVIRVTSEPGKGSYFEFHLKAHTISPTI